MKKVIYAIIICLLATGCVNENPKGQIEESYTSATDVEHNLVATLYNYIGGNAESQGLMGTPRGVYDFNSLTTDEQIIPVRGGDWYDGGFWQRLYYHSWTASESPLQNTWDYLYKVVMLCNRSLYFIDAEGKVSVSTVMAWKVADALNGNIPVSSHSGALCSNESCAL